MNASRIGIIGYGEAGQAIAHGLYSNKGISISVFDIKFNDNEFSESLMLRAREQGVTVQEDLKSLVVNNDIILSIVTGGASTHVVRECLPFLEKGKVFVDMNTLSPRNKMLMGEMIEKKGGSFVEVAILGAIASYGFKSPMLVCGERADQFVDLLGNMGFNVTFVAKEIGKASYLKMLRSVFAKGVEALLLEMLVAAKRCDLVEPLMGAIVEHMDHSSFNDIANTWLTTNAIHAERRTEEMEHVIETLNELNMKPIMAEATRDRLRTSVQSGLMNFFKGEKPCDYREVIDALEQLKFR
jgi:3-hydroxyisobutyrate dehydrogenase-like beta-hydroxyacid dehydrogenase